MYRLFFYLSFTSASFYMFYYNFIVRWIEGEMDYKSKLKVLMMGLKETSTSLF